MTRVIHSQLPITFAAGQMVAVNEVVTDDLGTYITLFIPHEPNVLPDAAIPPAASGTAPPPQASPPVDGAEPTSPPRPNAPARPTPGSGEGEPEDSTERAIALLRESGLVDGQAEPDVAPVGGSIADVLGEVRRAGRYLTLVQQANKRLGIRAVDGPLTASEETQLRALVAEILGGTA